MDAKTIARFEAKVDRSAGPEACHPWKANRTEQGYGRFRCAGKLHKAHRVAFFLANGHWPEPCGLHSCDNPPCCNAKHIFAGTVGDNNADRRAKGRSAPTHGEHNGNAVLSTEAIAKIKEARGRVPQKELARLYGVGVPAICHVQLGRNWRRPTGAVRPAGTRKA